MKNVVTYNRYKCPKSKLHITFGKNTTFKKLFQKLSTKVSRGFELGICGSPDQCLIPLNYDDIKPTGPI